jgi:hypothetical protein
LVELEEEEVEGQGRFHGFEESIWEEVVGQVEFMTRSSTIPVSFRWCVSFILGEGEGGRENGREGGETNREKR